MRDIELQEAIDDQEIGWAFNDITLTMIIIILFFSIIFATLVNPTEGTSRRESPSDIAQEKPTNTASLSFYGSLGFPTEDTEKGFPTKETFNKDLVVTSGQSERDGLEGNLVWNFEEMDAFREKEYITLELQTDGTLWYQGVVVGVNDTKNMINNLAQSHNVFVVLRVHSSTPISWYDSVRNSLWNSSNAVHWRFVTFD